MRTFDLQEGVKSLLAKYPTAIEDLYGRRSKAINDASEMRESPS